MMTRTEFESNNYLIKIELPYVIFTVNDEAPTELELNREHIEGLRDYCQKWLCEHPLPRYYAEPDKVNLGGYLVKDRHFDKVIADFKAIAFDNKKFAEEYAQVLEQDYRAVDVEE